MQGGHYPVQGGQYPAPGGQYPAPGGQYPASGGQYPPPGGQYPSPGGQYPPPGGQYPSPGGQYPLPGGQYPLPGEQYPPPGGQYAYAQGETDPPVVGQPYGMQGGQYPTPGEQYTPAQAGMYPWPGGPAYGVQGGQYGMQQPPVMAQPGAPGQPPPYGQPVRWMPPLAPLPGCPEGMEYLRQLDQVLVQQETHLLEVLTGWECQNKFKLLNTMGQQIYYAFEESGIFERMCCGSNRGFIYHITDSLQQDVFCVRRDFKCCKGCFCCPFKGCRYYAAVEDRNGAVLGYISNLAFCLSPLFGIFDPSKNLVAEIRGPFCPCQDVCCTADIDFQIVDVMNGQEIGVISKQWPGLIKNMFTDSDNFRVTFPINTDVKMKALMLGAIFILDIMLYETKQNS